MRSSRCLLFFFFNDTATTEIYTLSLHDALPISVCSWVWCLPSVWMGPAASPFATDLATYPASCVAAPGLCTWCPEVYPVKDRKSTRLNSSHANISYAVFCLKKKKHSMLLCRLHR